MIGPDTVIKKTEVGMTDTATGHFHRDFTGKRRFEAAILFNERCAHCGHLPTVSVNTHSLWSPKFLFHALML
jgi:hypothetical protein